MTPSDVPAAQPPAPPLGRPNLWFAWSVHLYTGAGALTAYFGTMAVFEARYRDAFLWMSLAMFLDATDGLLARAARVKQVLPDFDGARLDDIVDFLTFVFLPVLLLHRAGALPDGWGWVVASVVLLSSAYGFAAGDAKTDDHFFTGFPSYWNIVALYLFAAGMSPSANGLVLLALSAMVFVRLGYVYPSRMPVLRMLTIVLGAVWGVMAIAMILMLPDVPRALLVGSLFYPVYYTVLSFALHSRRVRL